MSDTPSTTYGCLTSNVQVSAFVIVIVVVFVLVCVRVCVCVSACQPP